MFRLYISASCLGICKLMQTSFPFIILQHDPRYRPLHESEPFSSFMSGSQRVEELRAELSQLGLDTRGHRSELRTRLRKGRKSRSKQLPERDDEPPCEERGSWKPSIDSFLVLDVEATCERGGHGQQTRQVAFDYPNESMLEIEQGVSFH